MARKYGYGNLGTGSPWSQVSMRSPQVRGQATAMAVERMVGMNTSKGPDAGNQACLWAVNAVLQQAGISPPWGNSVYVPEARNVLAQGAGRLLSKPEPGAIAIMRDNGSPPYPHIGIVQRDGRIISNSSSARSFSWVAPAEEYTRRYGKSPEYWKLS
jgi:hypothetical protein